MSSIAIWSLGSFFELISPNTDTKILWVKIGYLGVATLAPFVLMFTLSYVNQEKYLKNRNIILLMIIPITVIFLVFTNEFHGLIWQQINYINTSIGPILIYSHGIGVWLNMIYSYTILLVSISLLSYILINSPKIYKFQIGIVLIGIIFPLIFNIFYFLKLLPDPVDMTPLAFSITAMLMAVGVFKYRLLDILPIAHNKLFENMDNAYLVFDEKDRLLEINYTARKMLNISSNDTGRNIETILEDNNPFKSFYREKGSEKELQLKNYSNRWVHAKKNVIYDYNKNISGYLFIINDIDDRKKSEIEFKESQRRLKTLMSNLPGIAYRCKNDADWTMEFVSDGCLELTGYPSEDLINNRNVSYVSLIVEEDQKYVWDQIQISINNKEPFELFYRINTANFQEKNVWEKGRGIFSKEGELIALEGFIVDVTARVKAEEGLKKSLKEKEVLLQEIHHRVKNNMQIISSLLNLQSVYSESKNPSEILKETQDRVKSMALVHEKLYKSQNLEKINFGEYIEDLVFILSRSYDTSHININVKGSPISLDINTAIPCGLIINELITNSIKHAFPDSEGNINVEFFRDNDNLKLIVNDDGIGIPESLDIENTTTLGLRLLSSLVDQIEGDLKIRENNGSTFEITFQELEYKKRI
jgi:PAS domain S-box-containing protein